MGVIFVAERVNQVRYFSGLVSLLRSARISAELACLFDYRSGKRDLSWTPQRIVEAQELHPGIEVFKVASEDDKAKLRRKISRSTTLVSVSDLSKLLIEFDIPRCVWIMIQHSGDHLSGIATSRILPDGFGLWGEMWQSNYLTTHAQISPNIAAAQEKVLDRPSEVLGHLGILEPTQEESVEVKSQIQRAQFFEPTLLLAGGNYIFNFVRAFEFAVQNGEEILRLRSLVKRIVLQLEALGVQIEVRRRGKLFHFPLGYERLDSYLPESLEDLDPSNRILTSDLIVTDRNSTAVVESLALGKNVLAFGRGLKMYERWWGKHPLLLDQTQSIGRSPLWIMNESLLERGSAGLGLVTSPEQVEPALEHLKENPKFDRHSVVQGWIDFPNEPGDNFLKLLNVSKSALGA